MAGNDLADFLAATERPDDLSAFHFITGLARLETPLVAAVDGVAVGVGTTMLLHCDLVYAAPTALFRLPFVDLGLVPEAASSLLLPRRVGLAKASELLLSAEPFDADEGSGSASSMPSFRPTRLFDSCARAGEEARGEAAPGDRGDAPAHARRPGRDACRDGARIGRVPGGARLARRQGRFQRLPVEIEARRLIKA